MTTGTGTQPADQEIPSPPPIGTPIPGPGRIGNNQGDPRFPIFGPGRKSFPPRFPAGIPDSRPNREWGKRELGMYGSDWQGYLCSREIGNQDQGRGCQVPFPIPLIQHRLPVPAASGTALRLPQQSRHDPQTTAEYGKSRQPSVRPRSGHGEPALPCPAQPSPAPRAPLAWH